MTFPKDKTCCFTGHRRVADSKLPEIVKKLRLEIEFLQSYGINNFVAGGALGFDTLAALAVLLQKQKSDDIYLHLMLPCHNQCFRWKERDIAIYNNILERADSKVYLSDHYHGGVMQLRNRAMVDASDYCICYFDEDAVSSAKTGGGTLYTVNYARKKGLCIVNLWDEPPEDVQLTFDFTE